MGGWQAWAREGAARHWPCPGPAEWHGGLSNSHPAAALPFRETVAVLQEHNSLRDPVGLLSPAMGGGHDCGLAGSHHNHLPSWQSRNSPLPPGTSWEGG